jgi:hypothetical protein
MRRAAIPTADLGALARIVRRTVLVRVTLVAGIAVAAVAGVAYAGEPELERAELVPADASVVVVLDGSASVEGSSRIAEVLPDLYVNPGKRIRAALRTLVERDRPTGLVLFSDVAYELLPPRSSGSGLAPLTRFFAPLEDQIEDGTAGLYVQNPWSAAFSGGTQISAGLVKALEALEREGVEGGTILLLSDLDAPADPRLTETLRAVRDAGVTLRVVSLLSDRSREVVFTRLFGKEVLVDPEQLEASLPASGVSAPGEDTARAASLLPLVLAGAALLVLLALHELLLARLPLPRSEAG